ncbi:MAG: hypothetical protein OIF57_17460 [Marinobacterium sp.]|nr:hypothetical protein [Marinobacterium sp.]
MNLNQMVVPDDQITIGIDPDLDKSGVGIIAGKTQIQDLLAFDRALKIPVRARREAAMKKISQDVGRVKTVAMLLEQYLIRINANYVKVPPIKGYVPNLNGCHRKKAKEDGKYFNEKTGWVGRSNADKRDAAMTGIAATTMHWPGICPSE